MNSNEVDILLVEDSQDDVDLALHALRRENLANSLYWLVTNQAPLLNGVLQTR